MSKLDDIAAYRPKDVDDAADAMRDALVYFHQESDHRAIFARAYYLITLAVRQAVYQRGAYDRRMFFDAQWIKRLAGKFSSLYFQSLTTEQRPGERAWKTAHHLAATREASVLQNMLLGLNAHINYDLAFGIYQNLKEFDDGRDHLLLPRRKFDHDQVNNILVDAIPVIETTLTRDYSGEVQFLGEVSHGLDEVLGGAGLKYYRERVWWSAISFLATHEDAEIDLVHARLDWESAQLAQAVSLQDTTLQRSLRRFVTRFSKTEFGPIDLERTDFVPPQKPGAQAVHPF